MQGRQVVRCPFRVDLGADQIIQLLHLLFQDALSSLDRLVSFRQRLHANDRLDSQFGTLIVRHGDAVVAFEFDADFVGAGHAPSWTLRPLKRGDQTT